MYTYNQLIFPSHMNKNARFLVLAGFSLNGPVGTPFVIKDEVNPAQILGDCYLADNVIMARRYGITPLILRLNGSHGEAEVIHEQLNTPILRFKTIEANDESNNIEIHLFPTHLIVEGIYKDHTYYLADYKRLDDLVFAIKQDMYFGEGEVDVEVINYAPLEGLTTVEKHIPFDFADDGFNYVSSHDETDSDEKLQMQLALIRESLVNEDGSEFYFTGELSSFLIDTVLFTDIPYEKAPAELSSIFGKFASSKTEEQTLFCSVVLGSEHFSEARYSEEEEDLYLEQVQALVNISPYLIEGTQEYAKHVEVVVGVQDSLNIKRTTMPGAANYACMRYSLPDLAQSATNKQLNHLNVLFSEELKQDEVAKLSRSGYICIVPSIKKKFVPLSSKNIYPPNSILSKPHYLRTVHYDVRRITSFFEQFTGEPFTSIQLQSTLTQIENFIEEVVDENPFYKNIQMEVIDFTQSKLTLSISFELYGEIETVRTSLEYVPSSEVNITWK